MKRKFNQWLAVLLAVLMVALLFGCGKQAAPASADNAYEMPAEPATPAAEPAPEPEEAPSYAGYEEKDSLSTGTEAQEGATARPSLAEKVIYSGYLRIETTTFDEALAALDARVKEVGGFIESSSVNGETRYRDDGTTVLVDRYANYVVRVPSASFDAFMRHSGEIGNVLSSNTSAQNITSQFTDAEARRDSLKVQEERLLAMMAQTTDMESLIALEQRLSEVRYETESIERNLINWQNRVDYSDVTIDLREVAVYTPVAPVTVTFGQRLRSAFADGWNGFKRFVQGVLLVLARVLPTLILLAVLAAVIVLLVRLLRKRKGGKKDVLYALSKPANVAVAVEKKDEPEQKEAET